MDTSQELFDDLSYSVQVDKWREGVTKRREELFGGKRKEDPIPKMNVDWNQIGNRNKEERAKDAEWRKKKKRDALLRFAGKGNE